jgi:hypothetical protein
VTEPERSERDDGQRDDGRDDGQRSGQRDSGQWRDERELPISDLNAAMATNAFDGQVDDATGGDASAAQPQVPEHEDTDPDPTSVAGRRVRPSPDGRTGPL